MMKRRVFNKKSTAILRQLSQQYNHSEVLLALPYDVYVMNLP